MKMTFLVLIMAAFGFASCNKEPQPMTKSEINKKIDSLTTVRMKESDVQSQQDLQHRIQIEVKVKADSIATVLIKQAQTKDTAKAKPALQPHALGGI